MLENIDNFPSEQDSEFIHDPNELPLALPDFLEKDIPPLDYYVMDMIPKKGKTLISAPPNLGKSLFVQNMALAVTSLITKIPKFLSKFEVKGARVLYLDLEMGESALKERFQKMSNIPVNINLGCFVAHVPTLNLLDKVDQSKIEFWIKQREASIVIFDPVGNAWLGNENESEKVRALTGYLNTLIDKYNVSVVLVHHWRKATKDNRTGGQMAAGSYRWEAWADCHITLEGQSTSTTISCHKNRNRPKFPPIIAKLNEETLCFEFVGDYQKKYDEGTLETVFRSFNAPRVSIPEMIKRAKEQKMGSETTIRKLIEETKIFRVDETQKKHYLVRKTNEDIQNIDWNE